MKLFLILTEIFISFVQLDGQYYSEPSCSLIFKYYNDNGYIYGGFETTPLNRPSSLHVVVIFTVKARLTGNYVGSIAPVLPEAQLLENFNRGTPIYYRVNFPVIKPLPRFIKLTVNDKVMCTDPGDVPGPNQYVTTINLEHTLYYQGGGPSNVLYTPNRPRPQGVSTDTIYEVFTNTQDLNSIIVRPTTTVRPQRPPTQSNWEEIPVQSNWERPPPDPWGPPPQRPGRPPPPPPPPEWARPPPNWEGGPPNWENPPPKQEAEWDTPPPREKPTTPRPPPKTQPPKQTAATNEYYEEPDTPAPTRKPKPTPTIDKNQIETTSSNGDCGVNGVESVPLIYRGTSYERGKWPWLVAIFKRKYTGLSYICAGTLVSDRHIVTAAHCMQRKNSYTAAKDIVVRLGVYNLDDWADETVVIRNLEDSLIHESYNSSTLANDILVLTLDKAVEYSLYIRAACLWSGNTDLNAIVESSGVVAGWGASESGPAGRGEPRMVRMPIVSTTTCRASKLEFHKLTSSKTLCAGDRNGVGPCLGDSGGGLYILDSNTGRWRLRGIVSISLWSQSGEDTCNLNDYIVFTDAAQYLPWIKAAMSK